MYELMAKSPQELQVAHQDLLAWCAQKMEQMRQERLENNQLYDEAVKHKWNAVPFKNRMAACIRQMTFYRKIKEAIEAGFYVVPNFPIDIFAIRTNKSFPVGVVSTSAYHDQAAMKLPPGEGEYFCPSPVLDEGTETYTDNQGKTKERATFWPKAWKDVQFPLALARPSIMSRTAEALKLRLFDEVGLASDRSGDPMILGRIKSPKHQYHPGVTFFIAWYLDLRKL
jgi:hypothetical protein